MLQFLYVFCRLVHGFFLLSPLRARKRDNYCYRDSWKSNNFRERAIKKEAKNWYKKRMQKGLRVITLQGAIEKSEWLDGNIIISYFGGSNNIFADCISYFQSGSFDNGAFVVILLEIPTLPQHTLSKTYFIIDQQIARHFVNYSEFIYHPSSLLWKSYN